MKKIIITSLFLALSVVANAKTKKITPLAHKKSTVSASTYNLSNMADTQKQNANKNICRVTCTVSGTDANGNYHEVTVTAGSIFRSCATAGEIACASAYNALTQHMNQQ